MKKLHVKRTTLQEVYNHWKVVPPVSDVHYYIRCNAKGEINWDKTLLYTETELIERDNVIILK